MPNTTVTPSLIAAEGLRHLQNHCVMAALCHRDYQKDFRGKQGSTVSIRKPVKFLAQSGQTRVNQDVIETTTSITIDRRHHVSWSFDSEELTLDIEEYSDRYIKPAMIALANKIDVDLLQAGAEDFHELLGNAGTTPNTFKFFANAAQRLTEMSVPKDGYRYAVLDPATSWAIADGLGTTGNASIYSESIAEPMVRDGYLGRIAGFHTYGDQNVYNLTVGARPTTATNGVGLVDDTVAVGDTTVDFDNAGSSTAQYLRKGDVIQFAGVNAVNDISKADLGYLKSFVVTADVTTTTAAGTIPVYPEFNDGSVASTAAFQNCTALPANNAGIQVVQTSGSGSMTETPPVASTAYPMNLYWHKNAIALAMVPIALPDSVVFKARAEFDGISLRVVKAYDIDSDEDVIRIDVLYGLRTIYPELGLKQMAR